TTLPAATVGIAYSQTIAAAGGTAPYHSFTISGGALPGGLTLSSSGTLSGTPSAHGSFTFTVQATDSSTGDGPYTGSRQYTLSVSAVAVTLGPATLASAQVAAGYSQQLTASGGAAPYTFALTGGTLPTA